MRGKDRRRCQGSYVLDRYNDTCTREEGDTWSRAMSRR